MKQCDPEVGEQNTSFLILETIETGVATQPKTDLSCGDARASWAAGAPKVLELVALTGTEKRLHLNRGS